MPTNKYVLDVKTKGAGKSEQQIKGVSSSLGGMAKKMGMVAGAYFGGRALLGGISASIDAFGKQELAEKKLEQALGKTSQALLSQASALQQVSMYGDEDIIMMQSMLGAFTKNEDEIKLLTEATLDLASGMGLDLKSAGDLVAKTIGSSTNAMSRYGISVEGAVGSTERLETLTGSVAKLFGGQAKAQSETMTGSLEQMKNAIGDTAETMGKILAPSIIKIAGVLKTFAENTDTFLEWADGVDSGKEAISSFNTQFEISEELVAKIKDEFNLTTEEGASLTEQMLDLEGQLNVMSEGDFFQGRAFNKAVDGAFHLRNEMAMLHTTMSDYAEFVENDFQTLEPIGFDYSEAIGNTTQALDDNSSALDNAIPKQTRMDDLLGYSSMTWLEMKENSKQASKDIAEGSVSLGMSYKNIGKSAQDSASEVVISASQKAVSELIAKMMTSVPFPLNLILSAGAGGIVGSLMGGAVRSLKAIKLAEGMDGIVTKPTLFMAGEDGAERVNVTNLEKPDGGADAGGGGITLNISAPLVDESVIDHIIPAIERANRMSLA